MNNSSVSYLRKPLALLSVGLSLFAASAAFAQQAATPATPAPAADPSAIKLEKISVTGTRLTPPDFEGAMPVTSYASVEIAKTTSQTVNNFLRFNPTTFGAGNIDEGLVNGGDGRATIGLRGLSTLTLINGKRTATGDLNTVPLSAVDRVEILKDGNGAVYGADAVGGVINIITKHKFDGVMLDLSYQNTTETDISRRRFELVMGTGNDRGSVVMGLAYFQQNDMYSKDRNDITNTSDRSFGSTSGTPNPGKFNLTAAQALAMFGVVNTGTVGYRVKESVAVAATPGDFRVGAYGATGGIDRFPFALYTPTVRPTDRYNFWSNADYKLFKNSDVAKFYTEVMYMRNVSHAGLAPSPANFRNNGADGDFSIPANYYWNQKVFGANATKITSWDYRFLDLGPRDNKVTYDDFNMTAGVKGDISDRLGYDVNYHWTRNEQYDEEQHGVNRANLLKVLNGTSPYSGAQLFNPFTNPFDSGKVSNDAEMLRYIDFTPRTMRTYTTRTLDAIVNGKPFDLPAGSVEAVGGYEKRWETFLRQPDLAKSNATGSGWNGTNYLATEYSIESYFAEAVIPLLKDAPFAKNLALGAAARHESYSHFDSTPTVLRFYLRDQVNKELTLRLSYSEGFTIPSPAALDPTTVQNFPEIYQSWLGVAEQPQNGVILSGNPNLGPTTSKSYNFGAIWAPKAVKGLEFSFDFYQIEQSNIIIQDPQLYVDGFVAGGGITKVGNNYVKNNSAPFADKITIDGDGAITGVPGLLLGMTGVQNENLAKLEQQAMDFDIAYRHTTQNWGSFDYHLLATYTLKFDIVKIPGVPTSSYAGYFTPNDAIGPGSVPEFKGNLTAGWSFKNFYSFVKVNYTGAYYEDPTGGTDISQFNSKIGQWVTVDFNIAYTYPRTHTTIRVGMENAFNEMPPIALSSFADHYDRNSHNILGSLYTISMNQKF